VPQLHVSNGFTKHIAGLGRNRPLAHLSEKTITPCVRRELRARYGRSKVKVSCFAKFDGTSWTGECWINQARLEYYISP
jgi:hypothetical protein